MIIEDEVKEHRCEKCNKLYSNKSNLNRHLNRCGFNIKYTCEYCNLELTEKENLKRHLLTCKRYEYKLLFDEEKKKYEKEKKDDGEEIKMLKIENTNLKERIKELEKYLNILSNIKKEKIINNTTNNNNINIINITIDDLNTNGLKIKDLMSYGNGIANYVLNSTEIQDKIKLRDKARKLIEYSIEDILLMALLLDR